MLVAKKAAPRIAVVRVNKLAVERPVIKPDIPPPPIPSAPPSLFCSITTPISERDQDMDNEQQDDHGTDTAAISGSPLI